ncbi:IS110 family transposase [Dactylosporangium vinaceum]|uniref:IS110 family transposase n=1 Tax=Dactylosporangium vinaceum TaxID=53362 RepID=UPI001CA880A3|nr:IS110 family transposase [Dactylosporangium vinaceum]UAB92281.1 IS110 family transposase [Dactylosporangium vinaceum]UAB93834.1 IS110 family transposase [Dactylosporangium vinaceum]UAB97635.1 IS110 family transposase [Dactylosporangium vinaceum]UAB99176.1 IS110 family transposase [Dactylosporangium vinaceum]UAC00579.1 IS110 family transposase [Dactylosporangium vinaceum]
MAVAVGVDVAKELHWAAIVHTETGKLLASCKVANEPAAIHELIDQIHAAEGDHGPATVAIDVLGGIAGLLQVMLSDAGLDLVHVSGLAVNRARRATRGGEHKSDPRDAKVIADQIRLRREELRPVTTDTDADAELRLLAGRRRELVVDQTRRIARLRDLLASIHPGLERVLDPTNKADAALLARYVTPAEIRRAGRNRIITYLRTTGRHNTAVITALADKALTAATGQHLTVPGEAVAADIVRDLAREVLAGRDKLAAIDARLAEALTRHPDAALVQSLPGMGATLTAEFLAVAGGISRFASGNQLASAAGLAPVLQQSGKMHYLRRANAGDKTLKRIFYQSAFCALQRDPASRAFYDRKRAEGKRHHQALIALARRRINVLHAILRTRQPYQANFALAS